MKTNQRQSDALGIIFTAIIAYMIGSFVLYYIVPVSVFHSIYGKDAYHPRDPIEAPIDGDYKDLKFDLIAQKL